MLKLISLQRIKLKSFLLTQLLGDLSVNLDISEPGLEFCAGGEGTARGISLMGWAQEEDSVV